MRKYRADTIWAKNHTINERLLILDLVAKQGLAKKTSKPAGDDGDGTGLAMIVGREKGKP